MLRSLGLSSVVVAAVVVIAQNLALAQVALAQVGVEIYAGTPPPSPYYDPPILPPRYGPRVYGYRYEAQRLPAPRGGCGQYHYWNGEECLDARIVPPEID